MFELLQDGRNGEAMRGPAVFGLCFFARKLLQEDGRNGEAVRGPGVFGLCFFAPSGEAMRGPGVFCFSPGKLLQDARTREAMRGSAWQPAVTWDRQKKKTD